MSLIASVITAIVSQSYSYYHRHLRLGSILALPLHLPLISYHLYFFSISSQLLSLPLLYLFSGLARIGQGSKLEKLASTGRFGLGFSSTYHLTDTPSFVSGDHLVVFDPHCSFAPGVNLHQPGLRIRFKGEGDVFSVLHLLSLITILTLHPTHPPSRLPLTPRNLTLPSHPPL
jgi:hypothetical protein